MKIEDSFHLATRIFVHNRLRTFLTVLAVGVGVGTIVFLISLGYGFERIAVEKFANDVSLRSIDVKNVPDTGKQLDAEVLKTISEINGVEQVKPIIQLGARLDSNGERIDGTAIGASQLYFQSEGLELSTGRYFRAPGEVVVTTALAGLLKLDPSNVLGKTYPVNITAELAKGDQDAALGTVTVVGVVKDNLVAAVYVADSELVQYEERGAASAKVEVTTNAPVKEIANQITALGFDATTTIEDVASLTKGFRFARIILAVLGLVAVAVASIGLFNTMTISLLERTKEVGIMKALGASDHDIWQLFLIESTVIGFLGGGMGLLVGVTAGRLINLLYDTVAQRIGAPPVALFSTPLPFVIGIVFFGVVVGLITGIWPAQRAAKLNPLQALRYE
ncbi:ABC transporter permease [Candidatus Berkelbacteria bacterium]|nr:ABC transporter permease [Candidatus Berkelbacteria bacterium]